MKRIALSCAVVVAGSLAAWAAFPVVYVSQYKDADGNPYYEGATEGAAVYDNLLDAYNSVENKGTIWMENDFVCDSGTVACHGNNRLSIAKVVTIRSRSGDWRTGAEIHGAYNDESKPMSLGNNNCRCLAIAHGGAVTCIGIRLVHGSVGSTSGDDRNGGAIKVCGLAASYFGGPSRFENCLFADCVGGCVHGMEGIDLAFDGCVMTNNVMAGGASATGVYLSGDMSNCNVEGNTGGACCHFAKGSGNVVGDDPKLETRDGVAYVPKMHSPCKNAALDFGWMRDPADIRSKDLAGNDRIIGPAPDMGCYERKGLRHYADGALNQPHGRRTQKRLKNAVSCL